MSLSMNLHCSNGNNTKWSRKIPNNNNTNEAEGAKKHTSEQKIIQLERFIKSLSNFYSLFIWVGICWMAWPVIVVQRYDFDVKHVILFNSIKMGKVEYEEKKTNKRTNNTQCRQKLYFIFLAQTELELNQSTHTHRLPFAYTTTDPTTFVRIYICTSEPRTIPTTSK